MRLESVFLLYALPLAAQTASVEGVVTNALTGAPVPRAHVTLEGSIEGQRGRYGATSAADGKFSITGIAPGSYTPSGERVGFVKPTVPARDRIALKADDSKTGIEIKLIPTGTITGRVTNSDGEPVEGAFVLAEKPGQGGGGATTDEKGQFRLGGLAPGKYHLRASQNGALDRGRPEIRTDGTAEVHNAATWYPGVPGPKGAGKVTVRAGGETTGADIQLVRVPFVRVSGKVVGLPPGAEDANIIVWQGAGGSTTRIEPDGSFELWRLDPGKYTLKAQWSTPGGDSVQTAGLEIEVVGSNIDHLELRAVADSNIAGQLEFEDDQIRGKVLKERDGPRVQLESLSAEEGNGSDAMAVGGSFRLEKVPAGKYWVDVMSGTSLYVKSMRLGPTVIDGGVLDLSNGSNGADLSLLLSEATGSVSGLVRDESGNPAGGVVVTLSDGQRGTGRQTMSKPDGTYGFNGLGPGSYMVGAIDDVGAALLNSEDDDNAMEKIEIGAGEKVTKDLKRLASDAP